MRISTRYQFDTYAKGIAESEARLFEAQRKVSSGKRLNSLHDDPAATIRTLKLRSLKSATAQYQANLDVAKSQLAMGESTLGDTATTLREALQIAVRGANAATDPTARAGLAQQIATIQAQLLEQANSGGPDGQYLFAGQQTLTQPFTIVLDAGSEPPVNGIPLADGRYLVYNGDDLPVSVEIGPTEVLDVSTQGRQFFSQAYQALDQLRVNLEAGNTAAISDSDIAAIQASLDVVGLERAKIGAKIGSVDHSQTRLDRRIDELTTSISDIEDVDITQAIQQYKAAETAYQAALSVVSQGFSLSLMDFLQG